MPAATKGRITKRFIVISSLFIAGLATMLLISLDTYSSTGLVTLDQPTLEWFASHRSEWLTATAHIATTIMSAEALLVVVAISAGVWSWRSKERWRPLFFAGSFAVAIAVSWGIKVCIARLRPLPDTMLPPLETGFSLPSIHTFSTAIFIGILGYLLYSRRPSRRRFFAWLSLAVVLTLIAALTRLYLGYHWFTDTIASIGLALIALALVIVIDTYWQSKQRMPTKPKKS